MDPVLSHLYLPRGHSTSSWYGCGCGIEFRCKQHRNAVEFTRESAAEWRKLVLAMAKEAGGVVEDEIVRDDLYGSRWAFYSTARKHGLVTPEEYRAAEQYYAGLWNYVGD